MDVGGEQHEAVMSGHGFYNRHSVIQAAAAELGIERLRDAASAVPIPRSPQPLVVADYGCSQGQNSLRPMGVAVAALRQRTDLPVTVVHTDLPGNDFSSVFEAIADDPASYVRQDGNAYALAAGRSFYEEVLPPGAVALGWSATTTHWLSRVPCPVPGHLSPHQTDDDRIRQRFADQAAADWQGFLDARAAELESSGRLVMVEPCAHPDGRIGSEDMNSVMDQALADLVEEGRIDAEAVASSTLPLWMRTPAEYERPVASHADLELIGAQVVEDFVSPLWARFEADGDVEAYVEASIGAMRAWSEAMLAAGISDAATLDLFYERCRALGRADPERLRIECFHIVLEIRRV